MALEHVVCPELVSCGALGHTMCQLHSSYICVAKRNGLPSWQGMAASKKCASKGAAVTRHLRSVDIHLWSGNQCALWCQIQM